MKSLWPGSGRMQPQCGQKDGSATAKGEATRRFAFFFFARSDDARADIIEAWPRPYIAS